MTDLSTLPEDVREALDVQLAHCDGRDCKCCAFGSNECACEDVDWTSAEVYKLRANLLAVTAERDELAKRIADAPVGVVELCYNGHIPAFMGFAKPFERGAFADIADKRVALVKVGE